MSSRRLALVLLVAAGAIVLVAGAAVSGALPLASPGRGVPAGIGAAAASPGFASATAADGPSSGASVPSDGGSSPAAPTASTAPEPSASPSPGSSPQPVSSPSASPGTATPTPSAAPSLVPAPLTGRLVTPAVASRHVIAVMVDDLWPARPQSGFAAASVVWQAPAEGGIPRYMMLFQDGVPGDVGPVRSARQYFIAWASEWRAAYVHAGGSPQALRTLRNQGHGQLVYNLDEFSWGRPWFWRITTRYAPHNLYTNGQRLRQIATKVGAGASASPPAPAWVFATAAPLATRPTGGSIEAWYLANHIRYTYDRATNTYPRWVSPGVRQVDASTGTQVAPTNVVVMFMHFGALNDSHPEKGRLEATFTGSGLAYVATNGHTVKGRWIKPSIGAPTRFVDAKGRPIPLSPGQTFVQVMPIGAHVVIADGRPAPPAPAHPRTPPS